MRIRTTHFPAVKTLEDFNLYHLPSLRRDMLAHFVTGMLVPKEKDVILLGPPGIGETHLAIRLGVKAAHAGHSVLFDTASNWISRLTTAHHAGQLETELKKIRRYKLIIVDEVGYIPFNQDAANLFFQLIASRARLDHGHLQSSFPARTSHQIGPTTTKDSRWVNFAGPEKGQTSGSGPLSEIDSESISH